MKGIEAQQTKNPTETARKMEDDVIGSEAMESSTSRTAEEAAEKGACGSDDGGRRLINQLISSIISSENSETEHEIVGEEGKSGGCGIFDNLISNLTSPKTPKADGGEFLEAKKEDQETENLPDNDGGGVIDRIVSQIAESGSPTSEEASILMQSVVRD